MLFRLILPLLLCLLALVSVPAFAEWVRVNESSIATYYIDPATMQKNDSLRRVWQIQDLKQKDKDGELSRRALVEYECRERQNKTLALSMHSAPMAGGKTLDSYSDPSSWRDIVPGSSGETILGIVCAR